MSDLRCGHCGREGFLEQIEDLKLLAKQAEVRAESGVENVERQIRLVVLRCNRCHEVSLLRHVVLDQYSDPSDFHGLERIYPESRDVDALPERVRARYGKMLELAYEPDAFAMRAGKVLEAICSDQGYHKGNLGSRLDKLIADDRLPQALGEQAHLVREYRNIGSHDDGSLDVEADDVPLIRDFVESLLDYLYWGPAKLQRVKLAIERRQRLSAPGKQGDMKKAARRRADIPTRLVSAGVYSEGALLAIRVPAGVKEDRQAIEAWLRADEARRSVRWRQDSRRPIAWTVDGEPWNLSALIRHIIQEATGGPPRTSPWGPNWFVDSDGRVLAKVAEPLPDPTG